MIIGAIAAAGVALSLWWPLSIVPWIAARLWLVYIRAAGRLRVLRDGLAFSGPFVRERFVPFSMIEKVDVQSAFVNVTEDLVVLTTKSGASIAFAPWQRVELSFTKKLETNQTTVGELAAIVEARVAEAHASRRQVDALGLATRDGESLKDWAKRVLVPDHAEDVGATYRSAQARPSKDALIDLLERADVEPRVRVAAASLLGLRDEVPDKPVRIETDLPRLRVALERASDGANAETLEREVAALENELRVGAHER